MVVLVDFVIVATWQEARCARWARKRVAGAGMTSCSADLSLSPQITMLFTYIGICYPVSRLNMRLRIEVYLIMSPWTCPSIVMDVVLE